MHLERRSRGQTGRGRRRVRHAAPVVVYAVILMVGLLAPFDFVTYTPNDAAWAAEGGLDFGRAGVARTEAPPVRLRERLVSTAQITVEAWAEPALVAQQGPARIVSYSQNISRRNFTLGQQGTSLDVRLRTTETDLQGHPSFAVEDVFGQPEARHIVMTYDGADQRVYIDGALRSSRRTLRGSLRNWDPEHLLVFGNEMTGNRPWRGRLKLVGIYDRALIPEEVAVNYASLSGPDGARVSDGLVALYRFSPANGHVLDESGLLPALHLEIPELIEPRQAFLHADREYLRGRFVADEAGEIVLNLVIFLPLGFLLARAALASTAGRGMTIILTLSVGVLFSLTMETLQYFLGSRDSELGDVVLNGIGTLLGLLLALFSYGARRWSMPIEQP